MTENSLKDRIFNILVKNGVEAVKAEKVTSEIISVFAKDISYTDELIAYIDGGSRKNPGEGAAACIIFRRGKKLLERSKFFKITTNNEAEYAALLLALSESIKLKVKILTIYTDSELLDRQIKCIYAVKSPNLIPLFNKANEMIQNINNFSIRHIPREENKEADRLVNRTIDEKRDLIKRYDK